VSTPRHGEIRTSLGEPVITRTRRGVEHHGADVVSAKKPLRRQLHATRPFRVTGQVPRACARVRHGRHLDGLLVKRSRHWTHDAVP